MLRTRSFLIFLGVTIFLAVSALVIARYTLVYQLDRLEKRAAEEALRTIRAGLDIELRKLVRTTSDWAFWDLSYEFVQDLNDDFIQENLTQETFATLHIQGMLFYNEVRELRYAKALDSASGSLANFPEPLLETIRSLSIFFHSPESQTCTSGLLTYEGTALLLASCPILTSRSEGPARGSLVFVKPLDEEVLDLLRETANRPVTLHVAMPAYASEALLTDGAPSLEVQPHRILGRVLYNDALGRPTMALETEMDRAVHHQALQSFTVFAVSLVLVALWAMGALWYMVDRKILRRLSALVRKTRSMPLETNQPVAKGALDEIALLRRSIDSLLLGLEQAMEANFQKQAEIQSILEGNPVGIVLVDTEKRTVSWANGKTLELTGRTLEEIRGASCKRVVCPSKDSPLCPVLDEGQNVRDAECLMPAKDGGSIPVLRSIVTVTYDGRPHLLETVMDLRPQKALEEQLDRAKKLEAVGLIAGGVAHDLNNLLTSLMGYPDLLLRRIDENHPFHRPLTRMRDAGLKAGAIVQDLLTLARRGVKCMEPIDMYDLLGRIFSSPEFSVLRSTHPGVQFRLEMGSHPPYSLGSEPHLEKALINLIRNAAEAIGETGSVTVSVRRVHLEAPKVGYETIPPGRYIAVRVQDTGKGIPEKDLPHIFEPFYTKKKMGQSGTGLGMTIIWHAVKDMQGYIDVASRPDHGTTFTVYLPEMEPPDHAQSLPSHHGIPRGSGERILVVEDMEDQRILVKALLTDLGYRVETAANSREALQRVTADRFDALVLDMILEEDGLDGAAVYREVLKVNPDQKALVVSGDVSADRVAAVTALGVSHFVSKPYTVEKLASALHAVLHEDEEKPICL
ncbi:CHASE4 domain-containing protein [Desulfosoma sp.]